MSTDTSFDPSTADMVLSDDDFTLGLDADQADSFANVLSSTGGSSDFGMDPMDGDIGGKMFGVDESEMSDMSYGGATPLGEAGPGFDFDKLPGGKGSGPKPLGDSGSLRFASEKGVTRPGGFGQEKNPYSAPKYYTPQGSVEFQKMVSGLLSNVFGSNIRKPTIRSLI
jgi:hypothetical protein